MILNLFPKTLTDFFSELEEVGFNFCLVGGAVRDFYIDGKLGHDLDFEVRSENARVSDLKVYLDLKKIKYESLPYEIVRFSILDYDVEITPPRTEKLIEGNTTHHNFNSFIDYNLSYIDSFKRRDLTINAIGLELSFKNKLAIVIDPYNGLVSIKEKLLTNVSDDFFHDPVRLLRLIRYHVLLSFEIDPLIKKNLNKFNLESLSVFFIERELIKSKDSLFFVVLSRLISEYNIKYPKEMNKIIGNNFSYPVKKISNTLEFILAVLIEDEVLAIEFASYFNIAKTNLNKLLKVKIIFLYFKKISASEFKNIFIENLNDYSKKEISSNLRFYFENKALIDNIFKIDGSINILSDIELVTTSTSEYINLTEDEKKNYKYHKSIKYFLGIK